jgi:hypothetical protein
MAAAIEFDARLDSQGVSSLMRQMRASAKALNISLGNAVKFTAWAVADSLRAATDESPKKRKLTEVRGERTKAGNKVFEVERWSRGRKTTFRVFAKNKREASKLPQVRIALRGLARKSWHFAQRRLGSSRGGPKVTARATSIARRHGSATMQLRGDNPTAKIENYAIPAFKTSGQQTLNNVAERAARRMQKITAAKLAKRMGAR